MFDLKIRLSSDRLEAVKAELTRNLPDVKSSHRCEAIGRGFGFRTYAAALAAARDETPPSVHVNGDLFVGYLSGHGFNVSQKIFYHAAARIAIRDVLDQEPRITTWGIGVGHPQKKDDKSFETVKEMYDRSNQVRAELLENRCIDAFLLSLSLLKRVSSTKTIRKGTGSYKIKHIAENYVCSYPNGENLGPAYVPNGALIAAALHMGFKMKTYKDYLGYDDVNVSFNMSKTCIADLDCEIRPKGAEAEARRYREKMKRYRHYPPEMAALMPE